MWDTFFVFKNIAIAFLRFFSIVSNHAYHLKTTFANGMETCLPKKAQPTSTVVSTLNIKQQSGPDIRVGALSSPC